MPLSRWIANTKRVLAKDKKTGTEYEFETVFPDGAPDGTAFSAVEMNKIIDAVNAQEPQFASLTALNGFSLTNANSPAIAVRIGRVVHVQIGVSQPAISNRTFTQLPAGMYDRKMHVMPATGGDNDQSYPVSVGGDGRLSFNAAGQKDVYVNASFVLEE